GLFAHKTGILPQPLPSGSSSKYLGKQMNILPDDHRVEYVTQQAYLRHKDPDLFSSNTTPTLFISLPDA
uniref:hypothetical protein n=1 Tax=Pectobacterium sp. HCp5_1 TaxID=3062446 RepID=UPI00293BC751